MASWHQHKGDGIAALYKPHATGWKVVDDKPGEMASGIVLESKAQADTYAKNRGGRGLIIPPVSATAAGAEA